jgi:hypothetical protein
MLPVGDARQDAVFETLSQLFGGFAMFGRMGCGKF